MEIKIGIQHVTREVTLETKLSAAEVLKRYTKAHESEGLFELEDEKGRTVVVPARNVGYLELGSEQSRRVGFGSV